MKPIRTLFSLAVVASTLLTLTPPASAAATAVDGLSLSSGSVAAGQTVNVTGTINFGVDKQVIATDGAGDVPAPQAAAGMDLVEASITSDPAKPNDLIWTMKTASLVPAVDAVPEVVFYWWNFTGDEEYGYDARRSNAYRQANANTFFRVRKCPAGSCSDAFTPLNGAFDQANSEIRSTFRLTQLGAAAGDKLTMGTVESSHGTGARWVYGLGDVMSPEIEDYVIPGANVQIGLAPVGGAPSSMTPVDVGPGASPALNASLSTAGRGPGSYEVVVRACWGANCGEARTPLTIT